ncbi:MAG: MBL fold metallo-hydrolase, partial [Burkholderiales bacterium]
MKKINIALAAALFTLATGCSKTSGVGGASGDATPTTVAANAEFAKSLNLGDQQDFDNAKRGFIAKPTGKLVQADGTVLKDFDAYSFLDGKATDTVNPSLWRHAQLNANVGLYKVTDGVYQLRGFDIANMTLIEGKTGWILVDPLTARESAKAALEFARKHLGNKPVSAIIFTHAHADHYGGVLGITTPEEVAARKLPIVAPAGFMEEATSENVLV